VLVLGHRAEEIKQFVAKTFRGVRVTYVINERYRDTNTGYSLMLAATAIGMSDFVKFDADIVFDVRILRQLMDNDIQNALCVDNSDTLAKVGVKVSVDETKRVTEIGRSVDPETTFGVAIGVEKISAKAGSLLFAELRKLIETPGALQSDYQAAYAKLIDRGTPFFAVDITGSSWTEINTAADFEAANAMFGSPVTTVSRGQQRVLDEATDDTRKRK
jgi:choline kinase